MASPDSLSMLVTLELRERVNELSLASGQQNERNTEMKNVGTVGVIIKLNKFTD